MYILPPFGWYFGIGMFHYTITWWDKVVWCLQNGQTGNDWTLRSLVPIGFFLAIEVQGLLMMVRRRRLARAGGVGPGTTTIIVSNNAGEDAKISRGRGVVTSSNDQIQDRSGLDGRFGLMQQRD